MDVVKTAAATGKTDEEDSDMSGLLAVACQDTTTKFADHGDSGALVIPNLLGIINVAPKTRSDCCWHLWPHGFLTVVK